MKNKRILIFGEENNPWHDFKKTGPVIAELAEKCGYTAELTCDADCFLPSRIKPYTLIVIMASSGTLTPQQEEGLLKAISGNSVEETVPAKGLLAVHGATVLSSVSGNYNRMVGARLLTHPSWGPSYDIQIADPDHPVLHDISDFSLVDELYLMESLSNFDILLSTDYEGFTRPVAWVKPYGRGRVFYCALGHSADQLKDLNVQQILLNAVTWLTAENIKNKRTTDEKKNDFKKY